MEYCATKHKYLNNLAITRSMKYLDEYLQKELEENKGLLQDNLLYRFNSKRASLSNPSQEEMMEEMEHIYARLNRLKELPHCFMRDAQGRPYISPQADISLKLGYITWTPQGLVLTRKGEEKLETYQQLLSQEHLTQYH